MKLIKLLMISCFVVMFIFLQYEISGDGLVRYSFLENLIYQGKISPMKYSSIFPLATVPFLLLPSSVSDFIVARSNAIIYFICFVIMYLSLSISLGKKYFWYFLIILTCASMFPAHLRMFYGEVFTVCMFLVGLLLLIKRKSSLAGFVLMSLGVINTPPAIAGYTLVCLFYSLSNKRLSNLIYIIVPVIGLMLESFFRTGSATGFLTLYAGDKGFPTLMPYSDKPGFSYPLFFGILGLILSPGKGILFFAPGLLLIPQFLKQKINHDLKLLMQYSLLILIGLIGAYAKWWAWYGGWFWGPRFLLFASIPSSLAVSYFLVHRPVSLMKQTIVFFIAVWSLWIGYSGIVYGQQSLEICRENQYALEHLCWWVPEFSVLFRPFVTGFTLTLAQTVITVFYLAITVFMISGIISAIVGNIRKAVILWKTKS